MASKMNDKKPQFTVKEEGKEPKYYWLKLEENFFNEDTMLWLEEHENGQLMCLFYLKMCCRSLKTPDFTVYRMVGDMVIPYNTKWPSDITRMDEEIVKNALDKLIQIGFIKVLDTGALYMTQVQFMTGSETKSAQKKREQRERNKQKGTLSSKCPEDVPHVSLNCPTEKEKEKESRVKILDTEIDVEKEIETNVEFNAFWSAYPRQINKELTYSAWCNIVSKGYSKEDLVESAKNYAEEVIDYTPRFIKYSANFLLDKVFEDYLPYNYVGAKGSKILPISKGKDFQERKELAEKLIEEYRKKNIK